MPFPMLMTFSVSSASPPTAADATLLRMLAELNRAATAINRAGSDPDTPVATIMRLIAEGVVALMDVAGVPTTAVIYILDAAASSTATFVPTSRVAAGVGAIQSGADVPRPQGLGHRALERRRRVLSYEEADLALHEAMAAAGARVGACYPLIVADQPVAALYVYLHEERPFSPAELLLLDNFVNLAAMALHRKQQLDRVHRHLERKEEELARLRRADLLISSRVGLQETLESILQMALEVTGAQYGILRVVDSTGKQLVTRAIAGADLGRPATEALPINTTSITGWVAKYRQPLCIADVRADPWARIYYPLDHEREMRSELAVPLIGASGRLEGVINLESPRPAAFSADDSLLLQSLATQAVIAIQEVRLLDALQEIAEGLLTRPPQQVFDRVVELACALLNVPVAALWIREENELILQSATRGHRRGERVSLHGSLTGQAVVQGTIVVSEDVREDPRFQWPELARSQGWTQAIVVPLPAGRADGVVEAEGMPLGALSVYNVVNATTRLAASDWDRKVLTFLAHYAALAVRSAAHQEALRLAHEQRAAAETFAAVGDIAANLLHRLNNKIGIIPVRVEGIQDKCQATLAADPYLAANLAEIGRSAAEAIEALSDSLFYLRPIRPAPVDIASAVAQALSTVRPPEGVTVTVSGLADLPAVIAGQQRLSLVFVNLLENAITAMEGQGTIRIQGRLRGRWVEIAVSDTGPGIPPALHDKIFEFDYSGANRSRSGAGKLGFGLWWVKTLMARFGGTITVESDGCHGTTFILRLPPAPAA